MRALTTLVLLLASVVTAPASGAAQSADEALRSLEQEVRALREGQARLQREIQEIRSLLQRPAVVRPAPSGLTFALSDLPTAGEATARLVLMDFTDYQ